MFRCLNTSLKCYTFVAVMHSIHSFVALLHSFVMLVVF